MWKVSKKDQKLKSEYIDLINHKYHDLKHEIRVLRQLKPEEKDRYIDRIEDAILNDARRHCDKEKIMFSCIANCKNVDFMDVVDLGVLLGNILDNAMEASVNLPEGNRVIDLKLITDGHYFRIAEKNTYTGDQPSGAWFICHNNIPACRSSSFCIQ